MATRKAFETFRRSQLITPARLTWDLEEALQTAPDWVRACAVVDPEVPCAENVVVLQLGSEEADRYILLPLTAAVLFEATRFGGRVSAMRNRRQGDETARRYPRLGLSQTASGKLNISVARIVMGAGEYEAVITTDDGHDLRPEALQIEGAGKPSRDAQHNVVLHAKSMAERWDVSPDRAAAYVDNLGELLQRQNGATHI